MNSYNFLPISIVFGPAMSLYKVGETVLKKIQSHKGSIKNVVFAAKYKSPKQLYALVCETLKYSDVLEEIITQSRFLNDVKGISKPMAMLLFYDFLFGNGLRCSDKVKQTVLGRQSLIRSTLARIKIKRKVAKNEDLVQEKSAVASLPKYLRINTLLTSLEMVVGKLKAEGYDLVNGDSMPLTKNQLMVDKHMDDMLVFNSNVDFHDHPLYVNGQIIFQDKASCIPAVVLDPSPNCHVIDACAAPGNKTSHMAALMKNTGKIFAFDLDPRRSNTMRGLLKKAGVKNCELKVLDFLDVSPTDPKYEQVKFILVDPTCSGSGIVSRMSHLIDDEGSCSEERLESLAKFQLSVLNHALSFTNVHRVVYSTCSVHENENEDVVKQALSKNQSFSLAKCLSSWKRRGFPIPGFEENAEMCLRCDPKEDSTNGFFVALFERKADTSIKDSVTPKSSSVNLSKKRKRNRQSNQHKTKATKTL